MRIVGFSLHCTELFSVFNAVLGSTCLARRCSAAELRTPPESRPTPATIGADTAPIPWTFATLRVRHLALPVVIGKHMDTAAQACQWTNSMQRIVSFAFIVCSTFLCGACAVTQPAPGADQIRLTAKAADVMNCKAVGNIRVPRLENGVVDSASAQTQFRNQAVGLGGNAGFVTEGLLAIPTAGVAYLCP
jgi:hypothetical protein